MRSSPRLHRARTSPSSPAASIPSTAALSEGVCGGERVNVGVLSVVTTMYRSSQFLDEFIDRSRTEADRLFDDVEFILVNDGSPDDSLAVALRLRTEDRRIRVVDLSRNFGHHRAMLAGLAHARGDYIFLLDCDLEEEPELLRTFLEALKARQTADVAFGVQESRKGSVFERLSGTIFYSILNLLWRDQKIPKNMLNARLMTRRYVRALLELPEVEVVFAGLATFVGYEQIAVKVTKNFRKGLSNYTLTRKIALAVRSVVAFSSRPLTLIAFLGIAILVVSSCFVVFYLGAFIRSQRMPEGFTTLAVSIWFLGGLILFSLGIIAQYIAEIFLETKRRPRSIVREIYEDPP